MSAALIPLASSEHQAPSHRAVDRPRSDFLALLIATSVQAPQTRVRRRAAPQEAIAAYGAGDRLPHLVPAKIQRSL
jgi:hypothetical protein